MLTSIFYLINCQIPANMDLNQHEVDYLIQNLLKLKNPYTCPHGRPTTIKFSKDELFKNI